MDIIRRSTHSTDLSGHPDKRMAVAVVLIGLFLVLHGIAHSVGFFVHWDIMHRSGQGYSTVLGDRVDLGSAGSRMYGLLWLAAAAGFIVVGRKLAGTRKLEPWAIAGVTLFSLVLCIVSLPEASIGLAIDIAIVAALALLLLLG